MKVICINDKFSPDDKRRWHPIRGRVYVVSMLGSEHLTLEDDTDRDEPGRRGKWSTCWPDGRWPYAGKRFVEVDESVRHLTARERLEKYDPHMINTAFIEGWNNGFKKLMDSYEKFIGFEEDEK